MSQAKKIELLVIPDLFPKFEGDVQGIFVLDYLKAVEPYCNITVLFLRLNGKKGLSIEKKRNITIYRYCLSDKKIPVFLKPFYYFLWFIKGYSLGKQFANTGIIHSHGTILGGSLSFLLARKLRVPFIITEHQGPFSMITDSFWKRNWAKFIMQKANAVLTVSDHLKQEIVKAGIKPKSIIVTFNPVDTELFELKKKGATQNILFAGRLDNFKGALRCLKAFHKIAAQYPGWTFTIAGDGEDLNAIKSYLASDAELEKKVMLVGKMTKKELAEQMQQADFFVFPSRHESFGLVVAEALASGLPVITSDRTAPKEFVNNSNGILVPPDDIGAIAAAMVKMINSYSSYDPVVIRNEVIERFGFEYFGRNLRNIYNYQINKAAKLVH